MSRSFGTAFFAVVLIGSSMAAADAKSHSAPRAITTAALSSAADLRASEVPSAAETFSVPVQARAELRALESASTMPTADADLKMWSSTATARNAASAAPEPALSNVLFHRPDSMHRFARGIISRTSSIAISLTRSAMRFIGTPYVFGGTSPSGFDCSGYTQHVFATLGIAIPRLADAQFYAGHPTLGGMMAGDLVFFQTYEPGPSHVGIYLGNGRFVHSSSHGVMVSRLADSYWRARYIGAKRIAKVD